MSLASATWPYNDIKVLTQILTGHLGEPPFYFYEFTWICSPNWLITLGIHPSTSSLSKANTHIDGAGLNPKSHTSTI